MANVGNVFIKRLQTFFFQFFPHFFTFLTFSIFIWTFITSTANIYEDAAAEAGADVRLGS